jgi:hypothetical protein
VSVCACVFQYTYIRIYVHTYVYIHVCVCVCVYIGVWDTAVVQALRTLDCAEGAWHESVHARQAKILKGPLYCDFI